MERKIVRSMLYYSPHRTQGFDVPLRDEKGNVMVQHDPYGRVVLGRRKQPIPLMRNEQFKTLIDSPKVGYQCTYKMDFYLDEKGVEVPVDKDVYLQLEKLADDPSVKVIREETHKASINPTAFELEKQLKERDNTIASLQMEIRKQSEQSSNAIYEMQKQMAELKDMLEESTRPPVKKTNKSTEG